MSERKPIDEDVRMTSVIEHPMILEYARFHGRMLNPILTDFELALELQRRLVARGR